MPRFVLARGTGGTWENTFESWVATAINDDYRAALDVAAWTGTNFGRAYDSRVNT